MEASDLALGLREAGLAEFLRDTVAGRASHDTSSTRSPDIRHSRPIRFGYVYDRQFSMSMTSVERIQDRNFTCSAVAWHRDGSNGGSHISAAAVNCFTE